MHPVWFASFDFPVGLPCRQAPPPGVALLAEGLAGGGDGVERDDVAEGSDVRIADQRQWSLQKIMNESSSDVTAEVRIQV